MHFGEWLRREIGRRKLSVAAFAGEAGIPRPTVQEWLRADSPKLWPANIGKLASALGVEYEVVEQALGGEVAEGPPVSTNLGPSTIDLSPIPVLGKVSAARFTDRVGPDRRYEYAPTTDPTAFGAIVEGSCMEPLYRAGDVVVFSPGAVEQNGVEAGADYFIQLGGDGDGENTFKRVFMDEDDDTVFLLRPLNPEYTERRVPREWVIRMAKAIRVIRAAGA